jgi:hypothetical protein
MHGYVHAMDVVGISFEWVEVFGFQVDSQVLAAGAFLHDIKGIAAASSDERKQHHIAGADRAQEILAKLGWEQPRIDQVKHIIQSHRGLSVDYSSLDYPLGFIGKAASGMPVPQSLEAKIVRDADTFDQIDELGRLLIVKTYRKEHNQKASASDKRYRELFFDPFYSASDRIRVLLNSDILISGKN